MSTRPPGLEDTRRLFIAIELPRDILRTVEKVQNQLKATIPPRAAKWVRPEGIHLTLKFLGDVPLLQIDAVVEEMQAAVRGHTPFFLTIEGLGCFPNTKNPRVLWLGLTGDVRDLAALQAGIEEHITPLGYPAEDRGFHPHLTLARSARDARRNELAGIGKAAEKGLGTLGSWRIDAVSLMRSDLHPDGAVYTQAAHILLDR
jgi:RNA 2',3'-cyclic 3'-phosphodiesterase